MPDHPLLTWWSTLSGSVRGHVLRIANGQAKAGPITLNGTPDGSLARKIQDGRWLNHRKRLEMALLLRNGVIKCDDVRRCRRCAQLFLVPKGHPNRQSCSIECGRNFRQAEFKRRSRERKLARVARALKQFRGREDQLQLAARRAHVSPNFITYAVRRKEVHL